MQIEPSHNHEKTELRQTLRRIRGCMPGAQRKLHDKQINKAIIDWVEQNSVSTIGGYVAFDGEPDLRPALRELMARGLVITLPAIIKQAGLANLEFRQWTSNTRMKPNRYGIPEPQGTPVLRTADLDLILMPLVGWDSSGNRLGMGASFYDRLFQPFAANQRPVRAGVAYQAQYVKTLPCDPWDIAMHQVFTENQLAQFNHEDEK